MRLTHSVSTGVFGCHCRSTGSCKLLISLHAHEAPRSPIESTHTYNQYKRERARGTETEREREEEGRHGNVLFDPPSLALGELPLLATALRDGQNAPVALSGVASFAAFEVLSSLRGEDSNGWILLWVNHPKIHCVSMTDRRALLLGDSGMGGDKLGTIF
ncbi:unnamed protein product [Pleuronectes platessa]|uniref:Uncharacterized protein n=1 Tax=Pleuronectes platessa TaxID=8262 RepID=A0A9N7V9D2_PLEPL|nr:unnamed protein product [Pleuronectes platessa]